MTIMKISWMTAIQTNSADDFAHVPGDDGHDVQYSGTITADTDDYIRVSSVAGSNDVDQGVKVTTATVSENAQFRGFKIVPA